MKKILFVIDSLGRGGAERVTSILANNFCKDEDVDVSIISLTKEMDEYCIDSNIKVYYYRTHNRIKGIHYIKYVRELHGLLQEICPDVIISLSIVKTNILLMLASIFNWKKIVLSERNNPYTYPAERKLRVIRNIIYHFPKKIVFQTEDAMNYFDRTIRRKGTVISNPIRNNLPEKDYSVDNKCFVSFCRFEPQKNLPLLINAFVHFHEYYPDYRLRIYGQGRLKEELLQLIGERQADDYINILPFTDNVFNIMKESTSFVSSSDYEGISNAMLEALAIGVPCICTDCPIGGAKLAINSYENGILVPVGNEEKLIEAMKYVVDDPLRSQAMGIKAKQVRNDFSEDVIIKKWKQIIGTI